MLLKMAIRNILRNKRRSFVAAAAISIGLTALIFVDGLMEGMTVNMVKAATSTFMGEAQIHYDGFTDTMEVEKVITDPETLLKQLENEPEIKSFAPRVKTLGMVTSAANVQSLLLVGIDPQKEKELSKMDEALIEGEYISDSSEKGIMIGQGLADILEVTVGDRLVITLAQAHTGEMAQEMMRVKGIFKLGTREFDRSMAFIPIERARVMLGLEGAVHEIAVNFKDHKKTWEKNLPIWTKYSNNGNKFENWMLLMPEMDAMLSMSAYSKYIVGFILFLLVAGVIINTLFMSIYERMFEFGVMRAIGAKPVYTGTLVVFESAVLAVVSTILGIISALLLNLIFSKVGIDYTGTEFMSVAMTEFVYPVMTVEQYTSFPVSLIIFTMIVSIYPAWYAAKIKPAVAMKKGTK
ncbi:ABC transporter permease [bacterium]|nr:ABC transporter permease [bacterium]